MTRVSVLLFLLASVAACGVDGEPVQPTFSGAVTINDGGVHPHVGVGMHRGPLSVFLGL